MIFEELLYLYEFKLLVRLINNGIKGKEDRVERNFC